jgi:hypothetical protein
MQIAGYYRQSTGLVPVLSLRLMPSRGKGGGENMNKRVWTGFMLILFGFIAGCSSATGNDQAQEQLVTGKAHTVNSEELIYTNLDTLLIKMLNKTQDNLPLQEVDIQQTDSIDNLTVLTFVYVNDLKEMFHGIAIAHQTDNETYAYRDMEVVKRYKKDAISFFNYGAAIEGPVQENLRIISGYLNDPAIREIVIHYADGVTKTLKIKQDQQTFTAIKTGGKGALNSIEAFSENGKIIYQQIYD